MALVYRNVEYPSASAALLAYINQFDSEVQGSSSSSTSSTSSSSSFSAAVAAPAPSPLAKYDRELLELFGTPATASKFLLPETTSLVSNGYAFIPVAAAAKPPPITQPTTTAVSSSADSGLSTAVGLAPNTAAVTTQHPVDFDGNLRHSGLDMQRPVVTNVGAPISAFSHAFNNGTATSSQPAPNDYNGFLHASGVSSVGLGQGYSWLSGMESRPVAAAAASNWHQEQYASNGQPVQMAGSYPLPSSCSYPQMPASGGGMTSYNASLGIGADISAIAPVHVADNVHTANRYPLTSDWTAVTANRCEASVSGAKSEVSSILQGLMDGRFVSSAPNDVGRINRNVLLDPKVVSTPKHNVDTAKQLSHERSNSTFILPDAALHSQAGLLHAGDGGRSAFYSPKLDVNDVEAILARNNRRSEALSSATNDTQQSVINPSAHRNVGYADSVVRKYLDFDERSSTVGSGDHSAQNVPHLDTAARMHEDISKYDGFLAKFTQEVDESASSVASNQWPVHASGIGTFDRQHNSNSTFNASWPHTQGSQAARYGGEDLYNRRAAVRGEVTPPRAASPATESGLSGARSWELSPPLLRAAQLLGDIPEDESPPMMESLKHMLFTAQQFTSSSASRDQHPAPYSNGNSSLLHNRTYSQSAMESGQSSTDGITSPAPVGEEYLFKAMHHLSQLKLLMKPN